VFLRLRGTMVDFSILTAARGRSTWPARTSGRQRLSWRSPVGPSVPGSRPSSCHPWRLWFFGAPWTVNRRRAWSRFLARPWRWLRLTLQVRVTRSPWHRHPSGMPPIGIGVHRVRRRAEFKLTHYRTGARAKVDVRGRGLVATRQLTGQEWCCRYTSPRNRTSRTWGR
jgi:hypothetical protein